MANSDAEYQQFLADCLKNDLLASSVSDVLEYAAEYGSSSWCEQGDHHKKECLCEYDSLLSDDDSMRYGLTPIALADTTLLAPQSDRVAYLDRSEYVRLPRTATSELRCERKPVDYTVVYASFAVGAFLGLVHFLAFLYLVSL